VNVVDIVLIVVAVAAAVHGLRLGALVQILAFAGFVAGLALGLLLAVAVAPSIHNAPTRAAITLVAVLVPAVALGTGGRVLGAWGHGAVRRIHLGTVDSVLGVGVAVVAVLISAWLLANLLSQSRLSWLSAQIQQSDVLKTVQTVMPPVPGLLTRVQGYLDNSGFPSVFADLGAPNASPVPVLSDSASNAVGSQVSGSMVKVLGQACGYLQEGSGFVVAPGLVVTNDHVVAGEPATQVQVAGGTYRATPIFFDPRFDLAVLRTSAPLGPALRIDPSTVGRGTKGAVLGFPEDGPLVVGPAGVAANLTAVGRDIYNQGTVVRDVYQIDADVEPGNSGGPLVTPSGTVIGVVFSRSTVTTGVGYALASPGVLQRVRDAEHGPGTAVGTGACTAG
jgi:S1-C subfamily serine protease